MVQLKRAFASKRRMSLVLSSLVGVASVTALLVAVTATSASVRHKHHARVSLGRSFAVMRHRSTTTATAAVAFPSNVAAAMQSATGSAAELGLEPEEATHVSGQFETWVVPGSNGVCLVSSGIVAPGVADAACAKPQNALTDGVMKLSVTQSGEHVLSGLVPNGNSAVMVTDANGTTHAVNVVSNVYEVVGATPVSVSFKNTSGASVSRPVPNP